MDSPSLSVIIPVFNNEDKIRRCVRSIQQQPLGGWELIIVNDGSTDDTEQVLVNMATEEPRIQVVSIVNSGAGAARNIGIEKARGKYVSFVDADDEVLPGFYSGLVQVMNGTGVEIAVASVEYRFSDNGELSPKRCSWKREIPFHLKNRVIGQKQILPYVFNLSRIACNKLYRRDFLLANGIRFDEGRAFEDSIFFYDALCSCETILVTEIRGYRYYIDRSSSLRCHKHSRVIHFFPSANKVLERLVGKGHHDCALMYAKHVCRRASVLVRQLPREKFGEYRSLFDEFTREAVARGYISRRYRLDASRELRAAMIRTRFPVPIKRILLRGRSLGFNWLRRVRRAIARTLKMGSKVRAKPGAAIRAFLSRMRSWLVGLSQGRWSSTTACERCAVYGCVDTLVREGRELTVLFLVRENQKWTAQTVYDYLEDTTGVCPVVAVSVHAGLVAKAQNERVGLEENYDFFARRKMRVVKAFDEEVGQFVDLREFGADVVFYDQPHGLPEIHSLASVSQFALTAYIPYGYGIYTAVRSGQLRKGFFDRLWRAYLETEEFLNRCGSNFVERANARLLGYPKMDEYVRSLRATEKTEKRKTVVFAPHHSVGDKDQNCYGTFDWSGKKVLDLARTNCDVDWVLKPHPKLRFTLINEGVWRVSEVEEFFLAWDELPNTSIVTDGDYFDLFVESDAMITDSGSFLVEYLVSGKPLIHLVGSRSIGYSKCGMEYIGGFYRVVDKDELDRCVNEVVLAGNDWLKDVRKQYVPAMDDRAGKRVGRELVQSLGRGG